MRRGKLAGIFLAVAAATAIGAGCSNATPSHDGGTSDHKIGEYCYGTPYGTTISTFVFHNINGMCS